MRIPFNAWIGKFVAIALLFVCLAAWLGVFGAVDQLLSLNAARSWQPREGVITQAYVRYTRGSKGYYWKIEMAGTFVDDGQRFGVSRIGYGVEHSFYGGQVALEAIANRYPPGSRLTVFVDPDRPNWVILVRDTPAQATELFLGACLITGLLPLWLWLWGKRTRTASGDA